MRRIVFIVNDARLLGRFVLPSMLSMFTAGVYTLVDGLFVGWGAGSNGIAALNVAYPLALLLIAAGEMIGVGGAVNIAIARGRGCRRTADRIFSAMLWLTLPVSLLPLILFLPWLDPLLRQLGAEGALLGAAREYTLIIVGGGFFQLAGIALLSAMRNDDAPGKAMAVLVAGLLANVVLDYLCVIVWRGGVAGSAWATVFAQALVFVLAARHFFAGKSTLRPVWRLPRRSLVGKIIVTGIPSFGVQLSIGVVIVLHNRLALAWGGVDGVAAYAIISYFEASAVLLLSGVASGVQPVTGFLHGAGKFRRRGRMAGYAVFVQLLLGGAALAASFGWRTEIPALFNAHGRVLTLAAAGLAITAAVYPLIGIQKLSETYFQSVGRIRAASLLIYLDSCVILPICLLLLPHCFGLDGVWLAMPVSKIIMLPVVLALWRVRRGSHKEERV